MDTITVGKSTFFTDGIINNSETFLKTEENLCVFLQATQPMATLISGGPLPKKVGSCSKLENLQQLKASKGSDLLDKTTLENLKLLKALKAVGNSTALESLECASTFEYTKQLEFLENHEKLDIFKDFKNFYSLETFETFETSETFKVLETVVEDAALANFPYHRDLGRLNNDASNWKEADFATKNDSGFKIDKRFENGVVTKTGLTAFIFTNHETKEVRLVFGGTSSGSTTSDSTTLGFVKRHIGNPVTTTKQWLSNVYNAFSLKEPKSYSEAAKIAGSVYDSMQGKGYNISVSGHSKGGGEASYAAMMLGAKTGEPIKSINFSSAQLGKKLINNIRAEIAKNLNCDLGDPAVTEKSKYLSSKTTHVKVKGDPVPFMHIFGFNIIHLGKTLTIPSKKWTILPLTKHDQFFDQIRSWVKPFEEKQQDIKHPINAPVELSTFEI